MFTRRGDPVEPQMFWDPPFTDNQLSLMFSHSMFTIFALNIDNIGAGGTVVSIPVTINYNMISIYDLRIFTCYQCSSSSLLLGSYSNRS